MRSNKIISSTEQKQAYRQFMLKYEIYSLRIACMYGGLYMTLFLVIDYWRTDHYLYVVLSRLAMIMVLAGVVMVSSRSTFTVRRYGLLSISTSTIIVALSFLMDFISGMPVFFLPNFICLLLYVFNAGLGYSLKLKSIQSGLFLSSFVLYSVYVSPHRDFHLSQFWNLLTNVLISMLIGFLIERYKQLNFVQRVELLAARKKIEDLDDLKTKLISILSHDLSAPLNSLKGLLQLKEVGALRPEEMDHYSGKVKKSLENALGMLQNLVKWAGSQLKGFKLMQEKIDIKKTVDAVIELVENTASLKDIKILNKIENPAHLVLDQEILKIVTRNFLTNGIKFSQPGSFIVIASQAGPDSYTISVQDTGTGMSPEDLKDLFMLKKLSRAGTQNEIGSGIGLVITKEFVEMMNGTISVKSEVGKGSTFSVTFPVHSDGHA